MSFCRAASRSLFIALLWCISLQPARASGPPILSDIGTVKQTFREQWDKFDSLLSRIYGSNWKTAVPSAKAARFASWYNEVYAPISSREYDLEVEGQVITSDRRSIKSDQDLFELSFSRFKNDLT